IPTLIFNAIFQILLVSNNNLTQLPDELNRMSQLTELDASCNQLTHLPPRMGDLRSLQSLVLRNNLLLAVPIEVTFLKLARLDLRANRIGTLPIEIRDMASLIELLVEDNPLTSPPASLCRRGRVHIFKYLDNEAVRLDRKTGTLGRRSRKGACSSPGPPLLVDRLKHKRQNVDSGYSTSSDGFEKRWSQEMADEKGWTPPLARAEVNGTHSILSTPSTASPAPEVNNEEEFDAATKESYRLSPCADSFGHYNGNNEQEEKAKPLHQIQTYKEYKDALKQQRAHDVPAIYRTKNPDDQTYKTEPNTPTHHASSHSSLATSKSDPTPLNSALGGAKYVFDDTKKAEKTSPYKTGAYSPNHSIHNGNTIETCKNVTGKYIQDYVKPKSPVKGKTGILSHDNVPACNANGMTANRSPRGIYMNGDNNVKGMNGVKTNRTISWNKDVPIEKMSFTMRREIDKAREETDLINQLRNIIETRLKMTLPEDLAPALTDGVVLCHLANHIKPRSVASIHVPSPAVPKLTMARCRRNVDNFIEACRKIGVDEGRLCSTLDVTEALPGRGLPRLLDTVTALCERDAKTPTGATAPTLQDATVSLLLLTLFFSTIAFLIAFPPPN
ncbi:leucine-rich repeat and calponin -likey domain-containing protein 1, partial [Asbolus verrucosus]